MRRKPKFFIAAVWIAVLCALVFGFPKVGNRGAGLVLGAYTERAEAAANKSGKPPIAPVIASRITDFQQTASEPAGSQQNDSGIHTGVVQASQPLGPLAFDSNVKISAKAALVFDYNTGAILYSKNPYLELPIASLTKLINIAVAMQSPNFNQPITITAQDKLSTAPVLGLKAGDRVLPEDLVKSILVGSANDAALALSNHFAGDIGFLHKMNSMANQLGLSHTHYATPIGFDVPGNFSTAEDLAKITEYALGHFPYPEIWKNRNFSFTSLGGNRYYIENSNALAGRPGIESVKTGYTPDSLGSMIVVAVRPNGEKVVIIVLDSPDRDSDALKLASQ